MATSNENILTAKADTSELTKIQTAFVSFNSTIDTTIGKFAGVKESSSVAQSGLTNLQTSIKGAGNAFSVFAPNINATNTAFGNFAKKVNDGGKDVNSITQSMAKGFDFFLGRIQFAAFSAFFAGLRGSTDDAAKYIIKINEIRSINQEANESFDVLSDRVRSLSDTFGQDIFKVAEGQYETLSNQVAKGAQAFEFLAEATKLAITGVSTVDAAVNLSSSVLKSYQLDIAETGRINAVLFKGVELGRFRVEDIANSFGKTANLGRQLGVSLEEITAVLATFTTQGIKPAQAQTLLSATLEGLLKPTEAATEFFNELGFANGRTALQSLGLIGVLKALNKEFERSPERIAKVSNETREFRAVAQSGGTAAKEMSDNLEKLNSSAASTDAAFSINLRNAGRELVAFQTAIKNFFTIDIGRNFVALTLGARDLFDTLTGGNLALARAREENKTLLAASALDITKVFQQADNAINNAIEGISQRKTGAIAGFAATANTQLLSLIDNGKKLDIVLQENKTNFFTDLSKELSEIEGKANKARTAVNQIRGTPTDSGLIKASASQQAQFEFGQKLNSPLNSDAQKQSLLTRAIRERLNLREKENSLFADNSRTAEDINRSATDLIQLAQQKFEIDNKGFNKLIAQQQLTRTVKQIRQQEQDELGKQANIEQNRADLFKKQAAEKKLDLNSTKEAFAQLDKFDITKFKDVKEAEIAFGNLVAKFNSVSGALTPDVNVTQSVKDRLSLVAQELKLKQQILVAQKEQDKIEAQKKVQTSEVQTQKTVRDVALGDVQRNLAEIANKVSGTVAEESIQGFLKALGDPSLVTSEQLAQLQAKLVQAADAQTLSPLGLPIPRRRDTDPGQIAQDQKERSLRESIDLATKAQESLARGNVAQLDLLLNTRKFAEEAAKLPLPLRQAADELLRFNTIDITTPLASISTGYNNIKSSVDGFVRSLQLAIKLQAELSASAPSGEPAKPDQYYGGRMNFAFGGRGSDNINARLSRGEYVMNRKAVSAFYPQIVAMNNGNTPRSFAQGGAVNTTNIGDVNVNITNSNSPVNGRAVAGEIRRELRRNTTTLR